MDESNPIESVRSIITPIITVASTCIMSLSSRVNTKSMNVYQSYLKHSICIKSIWFYFTRSNVKTQNEFEYYEYL